MTQAALAPGSKVVIAPSRVHGLGVFAIEPIRKGEVIEECPCLPLERGYEHLPSVINHYLYEWPYGGDGRAVVWGSASIFNHAPSPNANWQTLDDPPRCVFRATRDIGAGEEVFIDYGDEYWQRHDDYPGIAGAPARNLDRS
jgi:SET domain-containing protein